MVLYFRGCNGLKNMSKLWEKARTASGRRTEISMATSLITSKLREAGGGKRKRLFRAESKEGGCVFSPVCLSLKTKPYFLFLMFMFRMNLIDSGTSGCQLQIVL